MSVRIEPCAGAAISLRGDVEATIALPIRALRQGFTVAISDGTLLHGTLDSRTGECRFSVAVEGAGLVSITRGAFGDVVEVAWRIEWASVAADADTLRSDHRYPARDQAMLALEERPRRAA